MSWTSTTSEASALFDGLVHRASDAAGPRRRHCDVEGGGAKH
eukprot:CAMPEP_0194765252 /NCGR_PEP_ID=MMETSP0323_2-20130528/25622_1 /TAXON_ID=2866 ORGANISM="Crypthecodinium cohnii, Strain Seligo" /NCGR_SAMPLE_ID=MMETSP0323_2 /ASSEMBLY_ACC=CAM_ASM_000346 /LENGTH=41 /DNA_ID= /DNA_START= /DNA_END= /DNA_ORIENTATION=